MKKGGDQHRIPMNPSTRTPDGSSGRCPVCGKVVSTTPSEPYGDSTCPNCGTLIYLGKPKEFLSRDDLRRLEELGVLIESDQDGEVTRVQLTGSLYNDEMIPKLVKLNGVPVIDVRHADISPSGVNTLRSLLPDSIIED